MLHPTPGHSPVAYADAKFCGSGRFLWVDVGFDDREALDELIAALSSLRDATDFDHGHLQDAGLSAKSNAGCAEIIFHQPGREPDFDRAKRTAFAEQMLTEMRERFH